jgi:hypothetical protein
MTSSGSTSLRHGGEVPDVAEQAGDVPAMRVEQPIVALRDDEIGYLRGQELPQAGEAPDLVALMLDLALEIPIEGVDLVRLVPNPAVQEAQETFWFSTAAITRST